jgi:hypothetical protein
MHKHYHNNFSANKQTRERGGSAEVILDKFTLIFVSFRGVSFVLKDSGCKPDRCHKKKKTK